MGKRLLVPVDGSAPSRDALTAAATEFDSSSIVIFHSLDPFTTPSASDEGVMDREYMAEREEAARDLLEEHRELIDEYDVSVETRIAHGSPSRAILGAIDDLQIDHVVIGSRGRTGAGRVLLGSVAETVAKRAPVSVTIIR